MCTLEVCHRFLLLETQIWLLKCYKNKNSYGMKIYLHTIKITLYSIKYIFIISSFCHDIEINFYQIKSKFVFSKKKKLSYIYFFHRIFFIYIYFSLNIFLVSISGLPFVFTKFRIWLSVCKLNSMWMWERR